MGARVCIILSKAIHLLLKQTSESFSGSRSKEAEVDNYVSEVAETSLERDASPASDTAGCYVSSVGTAFHNNTVLPQNETPMKKLECFFLF